MFVRSVCGCLACGALVVSLGCSKGSDKATTTGAGTIAAAAGTGAADASAPIAAVQKFLEAVKAGDTEHAASMLTPLALKMTTDNDLSFSPPGSKTAQFEILGAEMVDADKAVVETVWSDLDPDGQRTEESIAWALRLDDGRWRVSGMAADIAEDQPPLVIDFENPLELLERPAQAAAPQTPGAPPTGPAQPGDQVARDPFQQPQTR